MGLENDYTEALANLEANNSQFSDFLEGADTDTVPVAGGDPIPAVRNFLRQLKIDAGKNFNSGWNVTTNTPDLSSIGSPTELDYYIVTTGGQSAITGAALTWEVGDEALFVQGNWYRLPKHNSLSSATVFSDATARAAAAPAFVGQIGVQTDIREVFTSYGTAAGEWEHASEVEFADFPAMLAALDYPEGKKASVAGQFPPVTFRKVGGSGVGSWKIDGGVSPHQLFSASSGQSFVGKQCTAMSPESFRVLKDAVAISSTSGSLAHNAFSGLAHHPQSNTLVGAWRRAEGHTAGGRTEIVVRRSRDQGATWEAEEVIHFREEASGWDVRDVAITALSDGILFLTYFEVSLATDTVASSVVHIMRSVDGGNTFAPYSTIRGAKYDFLAATCRMSELPDGSLVAAGFSYRRIDGAVTDWNVHSFVSTDRGITWSPHLLADDSADMENETCLVYYAGTLYAFVRTQALKLYRYESTDGKTWSNKTDVSPPDYTGARPEAILLPGGVMALSTRRNIGTTPPRIFTTYDFGDNWEATRLEHSTLRSTYHAFAPLPGGTVAALWSYESGSTGVVHYMELGIGKYTSGEIKTVASDFESRDGSGLVTWRPDIDTPPNADNLRTLLAFNPPSRDIADLHEEVHDPALAITRSGPEAGTLLKGRIGGPRHKRQYLKKVQGGSNFIEAGAVADHAWMHQTTGWVAAVAFRIDETLLDDGRCALLSTGNASTAGAGVSFYIDNRDSIGATRLAVTIGTGSAGRINTAKDMTPRWGEWDVAMAFVLPNNGVYLYQGGVLIGQGTLSTSGGSTDPHSALRTGLVGTVNGNVDLAEIYIADGITDLSLAPDIYAYLMR